MTGDGQYRHQAAASRRLTTFDHQAEPTLITTGTGAGKTESFLIPVLDHCRRARAQGRMGVKAILLYPMNALATDQAQRLNDYLQQPGLGDVTAGLYKGDGMTDADRQDENGPRCRPRNGCRGLGADRWAPVVEVAEFERRTIFCLRSSEGRYSYLRPQSVDYIDDEEKTNVSKLLFYFVLWRNPGIADVHRPESAWPALICAEGTSVTRCPSRSKFRSWLGLGLCLGCGLASGRRRAR